MSAAPDLFSAFQSRFGRAPEAAARAPGRVNLIGEHTDYNDGFVLPIAVQLETQVVGAARSDGMVRVWSQALQAEAAWRLTGFGSAAVAKWAAYPAGVLALLQRRGAHLSGCDLLIDSTVPLGGGLSSSAALEVATALCAAELAGEPIEARELIDLCRAAEHEFAGVPCGLMDQTASLCGRAGQALLFDCRAREIQYVPCNPRACVFVIMDSGQRHELADGEYAGRRAQCEAAVRYFQKINAGVRALRDVSHATVRAHAPQMDPLAAMRALHVTGEIERTLAAAEALRQSDWFEFGKLMNESHRSLRDNYQVSTPEIERLVGCLHSAPEVLGARITGAGFGGSVVALAGAKSLAALRARLNESQLEHAGRTLTVCEPSQGAGRIAIP